MSGKGESQTSRLQEARSGKGECVLVKLHGLFSAGFFWGLKLTLWQDSESVGIDGKRRRLTVR